MKFLCSSGPRFAEPLNIRCSKRWAKPLRPFFSSREPTWYQTSSGLASQVLSPGTGTDHPVATDLVKVNYTGWRTDGKMFDSSISRGRPTVLPLGKVIAGWAEGIPLMVVGEKRRFWIPAKLAYEGKAGKPQGMLVFDVELLDILRVPPVPA